MSEPIRTETALCDALAATATAVGWRVYPEVEGWDLLLVWTGARTLPSWTPHDVRERAVAGYQIGVEAKLRANADVIEETLRRADAYRGRPDEIAVLVPRPGRGFLRLCQRLGIRVLTPGVMGLDPWGAPPPARRLTPPAVALQGSGGAPSPRTMSAWRVGALRICITLRARGYITADDFRLHGVDRSRWMRSKWIVRDGRVGRLTRYVAGPRLDVDGPEVGYEAERDALAARDAEMAA